ncbi:MAG: hypothetical protein IT349_19215 [Candidatus Eisenbacteria bacterium]|nr:hypothetical protein [Candidatus Eisenbacteria bacterium]
MDVEVFLSKLAYGVERFVETAEKLIKVVGADQYWLADWLYLVAWSMIFFAIYRAQRDGKINLWDLVTTTDKQGIVRTDPRKTFEAGAFSSMFVGSIYLGFQGKIVSGEGIAYMTLFTSLFVAARTLRDREQRLSKQEHNGKADP